MRVSVKVHCKKAIERGSCQCHDTEGRGFKYVYCPNLLMRQSIAATSKGTGEFLARPSDLYDASLSRVICLMNADVAYTYRERKREADALGETTCRLHALQHLKLKTVVKVHNQPGAGACCQPH